MKLDSVLSLKQELAGELTQVSAPVPGVYRTFAAADASVAGLSARLDSTHTRRPSSVTAALGVAQGKGSSDYRLGARVQVAGAAGTMAFHPRGAHAWFPK